MKNFIFLALGSMLLFACNNQPQSSAEPAKDTSMTVKESKPAQAEMADPKYMDMGRKLLAQFSSGDLDSWGDAFADNARYTWSSGDSLVGKKPILDYFKNRRNKVIDSLQYSEIVLLPVKVNTPQARGDRPGIWLLAWYQSNIKYKNGKRLIFFSHMLFHYDASDKIDQAIAFLDRAPINKALGVK